MTISPRRHGGKRKLNKKITKEHEGRSVKNKFRPATLSPFRTFVTFVPFVFTQFVFLRVSVVKRVLLNSGNYVSASHPQA